MHVQIHDKGTFLGKGKFNAYFLGRKDLVGRSIKKEDYFIILLKAWRPGIHGECLFLLARIVLWLTLPSAVLTAGQGVAVGTFCEVCTNGHVILVIAVGFVYRTVINFNEGNLFQ